MVVAGPAGAAAACQSLSSLCPSADVQAELDNGASIAALRRFNDNLSSLPTGTWGERSGRSGQAGRGGLARGRAGVCLAALVWGFLCTCFVRGG